jgi:hypothetical protein
MDVLWIIFAHYIGDWGLQNPWVAENKGKYWIVMVSHCIVWTGCICFCLQWLGIFATWKVFFLVLGHILADEIKCHWPSEIKEWHVFVDQVFHLIQCGVVVA